MVLCPLEVIYEVEAYLGMVLFAAGAHVEEADDVQVEIARRIHLKEYRLVEADHVVVVVEVGHACVGVQEAVVEVDGAGAVLVVEANGDAVVVVVVEAHGDEVVVVVEVCDHSHYHKNRNSNVVGVAEGVVCGNHVSLDLLTCHN